MKLFFSAILATISLALMGCGGGHQWVAKDTFELTPNARVIAWQQGVGKNWYGGTVQGGQALVQLRPSREKVKEKIRLEWYRQNGRCPSPEQITKVEKGWEDFLTWSEKEGKSEELINIISTFNLPLQAPGPAVLSAIVKAVADGASGIIGPYLFAANLRPSQIAVQQSGGGATAYGGSTGPITAIGQGGAGGAGGSAISSSSSSAAAAAAAAAGAAAYNTGSRRSHHGCR